MPALRFKTCRLLEGNVRNKVQKFFGVRLSEVQKNAVGRFFQKFDTDLDIKVRLEDLTMKFDEKSILQKSLQALRFLGILHWLTRRGSLFLPRKWQGKGWAPVVEWILGTVATLLFFRFGYWFMESWTNPGNLTFNPGASGSGSGGGPPEPPREFLFFPQEPDSNLHKKPLQELDLFPQEPEGGREEEENRPEAQPKPKRPRQIQSDEFAQTQIENLIKKLQQVYESRNPQPLQREQYRETVVAYIGTKGSKALQKTCECLEKQGGKARAYRRMVKYITSKYGGDHL